MLYYLTVIVYLVVVIDHGYDGIDNAGDNENDHRNLGLVAA